MEPIERLAALESEVKKLREEMGEIKEQLIATQMQNASKSTPAVSGNYMLKVPIDEDEWIYVIDPQSGNKITYMTQEEAEEAGKRLGMYRVEKKG
jgi:hypothetical protein